MIQTKMDIPSSPFYSSHIIRLSLLLMKLSDHALGKKYNLTHSQFSILFLLHHCDKQSQVEIADKLNLTTAAISKMINTLVKKDLVERAENPHNRRENTLHLTPHGRKIVIGATEILLKMEQQLYPQLDSHQLKNFVTVCEQLTQLLVKHQ